MNERCPISLERSPRSFNKVAPAIVATGWCWLLHHDSWACCGPTSQLVVGSLDKDLAAHKESELVEHLGEVIAI